MSPTVSVQEMSTTTEGTHEYFILKRGVCIHQFLLFLNVQLLASRIMVKTSKVYASHL